MTTALRRLYWITSQQLGFDPVRFFRFFVALPWYVRDLMRFRTGYKGELELMPCLHDRSEQSGAIATEYFAQDLFVAQSIFQANPLTHVDIGSRIDGFVAHVATFRRVQVLDIRPNTAQIENIDFVCANLMSPPDALVGSVDSLSCLHTLEHFGLGRYGDPLDPAGPTIGLRHMAALVAEGGTFYLSVPVGRARVAFNAHRIFDPRALMDTAAQQGLVTTELHIIDAKGRRARWDGTASALARVATDHYALAVFVFRKSGLDSAPL